MDETRRYHEKIYNNKEIYSDDGWLKEPEPGVIDLLEHLETKENLSILDLCSGIGRNSIRLAQILKGSGSKITCVDMLETATDKLKKYTGEYNVEDVIEIVNSDILDYEIETDSFDYIISWSCIEHLDAKSKFDAMLQKIRKGTKTNGINCLMINSNVMEYDIEDKMNREALIELNFKKEELISKLKEVYHDWNMLFIRNESYINHLERYGKKYIFKSHPVVMAAKKR